MTLLINTTMNMRIVLDLCEDLFNHRVDMNRELPDVVYHGTNLYAALLIMKSNSMDATEPVDDDGLGTVVCLTASGAIAEMFAYEFVRTNVTHDFGVVFALDGKKIAAHDAELCNSEGSETRIKPYNADTQGTNDEQEFRVQFSLRPLKTFLKSVYLVGDTTPLNDRRAIREMYEAKDRLAQEVRSKISLEEFRRSVTRLLKLSQ